MANKNDSTQLKHVLASQLHLYYERKDDNTCVLRRIRAYGRSIEMPDDGVIIDELPDNIVGSEQIKDDSIGINDLNQQVRESIGTGGVVAKESDVRDIVQNY